MHLMSGNDHDQSGGFRQQLDAVLRERNPAALRAFLVGEGQWEPEALADEEAAMWMMIAASPVLADLHAEAERWLMAHGHEHEARAILGSGRGRATATQSPAGRRSSGPKRTGAGGTAGAGSGHGKRGTDRRNGTGKPRRG